jgi:hypothetical protein
MWVINPRLYSPGCADIDIANCIDMTFIGQRFESVMVVASVVVQVDAHGASRPQHHEAKPVRSEVCILDV